MPALSIILAAIAAVAPVTAETHAAPITHATAPADAAAPQSMPADAPLPAATPVSSPTPAMPESRADAAWPGSTTMSAAALAGSALELTVTATRLEQDVFTLPPMTSVIEARLGQVPMDQTPDLLRTTPGVLIQKSNHGGGSPFLHGLTGKQVLLLVDGVRMNNSIYRYGPHQYLNTVDPYQIRRIEIVGGPGSVLYGSDALGGVVNILTDEPSGRAGAGFALGGETADASLRGRFEFQGSAEETGWLLGASAHRFGNLRAGGDVGVQPHTAYEALAADAKVRHRLSARFTLTGAAQYVRQFDVPKSNEMLLGGKTAYFYEPQVRLLTYAQADGRDLGAVLFDAVRLNVNFQLHEEGEVIRDTPTAPEIRERTAVRTPGAFVHFTRTLGERNTLGYGGELYADRIASEAEERSGTGVVPRRPTFPDDARYTSWGAYLQDAWRPLDSLHLLAGGRYSRFRADGSLPSSLSGRPVALALDADDWTGSAGAVWEFLSGLAVAGQVAQGFRAPNMEDFFGKVDFAREIPNPQLRPEKSLDWEGGLRLRRAGVRAEAFYFDSRYRDLIDRADVRLDIDGDGTLDTVAQRRNIGRARIRGVAGGLTWNPDPLELFATYSWTKGDTLEHVGGEWTPTEPLRRIPPQLGAGGIRWLWATQSFAGAEVEWADRQDRLAPGDISDPRIGPGGTPGYAVLHLRGGIDFGEDGRLLLGLENVFDRQYKDHGSGIWYAGRNAYVEYRIGL